MAAALVDPDPVLYYEHIGLYRDPKIKQALADEPPAPIPLGRAALRRAGSLEWRAGAFDPALMETAVLAIAATDDPIVNAEVSEAAARMNKLVNVVDDGDRSSFITPSIIDRSPVVVAVSTGGAMPVLARWLRERIETLLPAGLGRLAAAAAALRERVGLQADTARPIGTIVHVFSHRKLTARVFEVRASGHPDPIDWYVDATATPRPSDLPLSKLARKLLALGGVHG